MRKNKGNKGERGARFRDKERENKSSWRASERASGRESRGRERTRVCGRSLFRDDRREAPLFSPRRPRKGLLLLLLLLPPMLAKVRLWNEIIWHKSTEVRSWRRISRDNKIKNVASYVREREGWRLFVIFNLKKSNITIITDALRPAKFLLNYSFLSMVFPGLLFIERRGNGACLQKSLELVGSGKVI